MQTANRTRGKIGCMARRLTARQPRDGSARRLGETAIRRNGFAARRRDRRQNMPRPRGSSLTARQPSGGDGKCCIRAWEPPTRVAARPQVRKAALQHGHTAARKHGHTAARKHGRTAARPHGRTAARPHGPHAARRLHGCTACARPVTRLTERQAHSETAAQAGGWLRGVTAARRDGLSPDRMAARQHGRTAGRR